MALVRIEGIDAETSPSELRFFLERFGVVASLSLYEDEDLVYALAEMDRPVAEAVIEEIEQEMLASPQRERWPRIRAMNARTLGKRWLKHSWQPPEKSR